MMGHGIGGGLGWGFFIIAGLFKIALLVAVIWLIVWAVRRFTSHPVAQTPSSNGSQSAAAAIEVLQARYARGEVTREQYLEILEDLKK